ncbi:hypothetical protein U0070_018064 [Myodes glareolus]|uniref:Uncharacterized protein n=1 Tax=Myodes glareolus TaxID=447135 RepID=A0AAW0IJM7_MYOGA
MITNELIKIVEEIQKPYVQTDLPVSILERENTWFFFFCVTISIHLSSVIPTSLQIAANGEIAFFFVTPGWLWASLSLLVSHLIEKPEEEQPSYLCHFL